MIDEVEEVKEYLSGKDVGALYEYHAVYLMARYFLSIGLDGIQTREKIFEWGSRCGHYIQCSVNRAIAHAKENKAQLRDGVTVYISDEDIHEINRRFDNHRIKFLALAMLAYGKIVADENGVCDISVVGLSGWLGMDYSSVRRWIKELIDYAYIENIPMQHRKSKKRKPVSRIKFLVPLKNEGRYVINGNNVAALANELF